MSNRPNFKKKIKRVDNVYNTHRNIVNNLYEGLSDEDTAIVQDIIKDLSELRFKYRRDYLFSLAAGKYISDIGL